VPNVRRDHFDLVAELFLPALNVLAASLPSGGNTITEWRSSHDRFLATLPSAP
jgi:hypothetical protein